MADSVPVPVGAAIAEAGVEDIVLAGSGDERGIRLLDGEGREVAVISWAHMTAAAAAER